MGLDTGVQLVIDRTDGEIAFEFFESLLVDFQNKWTDIFSLIGTE